MSPTVIPTTIIDDDNVVMTTSTTTTTVTFSKSQDDIGKDSLKQSVERIDNEMPKKTTTGRMIKRLQERKYFDSGDYAIAKTSPDGPSNLVGRLHPSPERMPHSISTGSVGKSPMKDLAISCDSLVETIEEYELPIEERHTKGGELAK